jgi:lysophospholipase L1-like esterase
VVTRAAAAALVLVLAAGCSWTRGAASRTLPADRGAAVLYVALGDSTVEGIGASHPDASYVSLLHARLRAIYPHARLLNLGVGGATSSDVLERQLGRALSLQPQLVTLSVGPNDLTAGVPLAAYARTMEALLGRLATDTRAVIVVNLLPDLAVTPRFRGRPEEAAVGRLSAEFNEALARVAGRHGAHVVDLYAPSRREVPARPELVAGDGYHPSDLGYARWAELMWEAVQRRIRAGA